MFVHDWLTFPTKFHFLLLERVAEKTSPARTNYLLFIGKQKDHRVLWKLRPVNLRNKRVLARY